MVKERKATTLQITHHVTNITCQGDENDGISALTLYMNEYII